MSCASMPPTTAHTGENSCRAVVDTVLMNAVGQKPAADNVDDSLYHLQRDGRKNLLVDVRGCQQIVSTRLQFSRSVAAIGKFAVVRRLIFPECCYKPIRHVSISMGPGKFIPRIANTTAGLSSFVWRLVSAVHRCSNAACRGG